MTETIVPEMLLDSKVMELTRVLSSYGIPLDQWGTGKAKTISHLANEVLEGETVLVEENGEIIRKIELVRVEIYYSNNGVDLMLVEDRQVFSEGRERKRDLTGLSEKLKPGEDPIESAKRALREELNLSEDCQIQSVRVENTVQESRSYPKLTTKSVVHRMSANLPDSAFRPEGYIEVQPDKSTYFVWEAVKQL